MHEYIKDPTRVPLNMHFSMVQDLMFSRA